MKRRIVAFGLFTLFLTGLSLTQTRAGLAESFSSGPSVVMLPAAVDKERSPFYAGGCAGNPSLETASTASSLPRMSSVYGIADLIGTESVSTPLTAYVSSPTISGPAAVQACAPHRYCLWAGCYYELLNDAHFDEPGFCSPDWIFPAGYVTPSSSICSGPGWPTFSKVAVLPYASHMNQSFFVPYEDGKLSASLIFATVGRPTFNDRIVVELWEGSLLRTRVSIRTDLGPFDCHREDYTLVGTYKGKNLKVRVRSLIVTPGVEFHIDSFQLFYTL